MKLKDKTVLITGAGSGLGREMALVFSREGANIGVNDVRPEAAQNVVTEIEREGGRAVGLTADVSDSAAVRKIFAEFLATFGTIDILVNNAALYYDIDNTDNSPDYLKRVFDVNLHGAWFMSRAVTPTMCEKRWGRIINQSSGAAYIYLMPPEERFRELGAFTYSQTKWGIVGLTKFMAGQLGQYNVLVNCIAPGVTMTEATKKIVPEEFMGMITMMSAMKRTLEPEDLAGTAVFFASDDANFVTGQVLCVDGGACMPA
jgi:3-oxoacyl-[acyl-carrier protein] reductase